MAETDGEEADHGRFLRAMNDQSRRAHDFDRRMRYFRLRRQLVQQPAADDGTVDGETADGGGAAADGVPAAGPTDDGDLDLRPTEERAEPHRSP